MAGTAIPFLCGEGGVKENILLVIVSVVAALGLSSCTEEHPGERRSDTTTGDQAILENLRKDSRPQYVRLAEVNRHARLLEKICQLPSGGIQNYMQKKIIMSVRPCDPIFYNNSCIQKFENDENYQFVWDYVPGKCSEGQE
jgi:hypothetical protein